MRKVKYTQQTWHDKLSRILEDFPKVRSAAQQGAARRKVAQCSTPCVRDGWCSAGAAVARWQP